jgi:4-hydroxybenzoate polyprenyltransferase
MKSIASFLKFIRFGNLLMMVATLILTRVCLNDTLQSIFGFRFILLIIATTLTAAAGYIINDYYDQKLDSINKPTKVFVGFLISRRWAMFLHLLLNLIAITLGFIISVKVGLLILVCALLLWLYAINLKKQLLIGNILVAGMSAFVIVILKIFDHNTSTILVLIYSAFAFIISILREIIKDIEDIKGDKIYNCKTLPITFGIIKTKKVLIITTFLFITFLLWVIYDTPSFFEFHLPATLLYYRIFIIGVVIVPLIMIIFMIKKARIKKDFSRLSFITKLIMLFGILSLCFFRY